MTTDQIELGLSASGRTLGLDVPHLISTRLLVQANSGGGKSWLLRRLLEQSHGAVQHLVIDPEGEFATLRERHDYVLAAAGDGGDCPVEPRSAHLLARKLMELRVSAILDIYELKQHERIAFVDRFLTALVNLPKRLWHPVLVVVDEAHVFCPERGKADSGGAVVDLATRGRKRGMCAVLATQRLSKLRKDAAAELNNVLIGRTGLDVDMARAGDVLGLSTRADRMNLRGLDPGEFFAFGPAIADGKGIYRLRIGDVQTSHPTTGSRLATEPPPPSDEIRAVLAELATLPEAAAKEAQDVESLRRDNAGLRRRVRQLERTSGPDDAEVARQVDAATAPLRAELDSERSRSAGLQEIVVGWEQYADDLDRASEALRSVQSQRPAAPQSLDDRGSETSTARVGNTTAPRNSPHDDPASGSDCEINPLTDLTRPQQAILDGLAVLHVMGVHPAKRTHVAAFAGASPRSSAFTNNLGRLRTRGLIDYPGSGMVCLTREAGYAAAATPLAVPTLEVLRDRWLELVTEPQARLLRALFDRWPQAHERHDLAAEVGASPRSSAFANNLGRLRSLGLITYINAGDGERQVRAADDLFASEGGSG